ncbi:response regulator transcription factor [Frankia sp. QA3]|uniref:response regulator transcription factor n=1 Tax=Frankia sp. QA3 TaxID=710111 RepID=UPI000269CEB8|nr:response regulator transcription factor [Frankia sp. QA3]EIV96247.1 response regulator with CheY-like receiver domain and winged-helix DNA-binding domain [Frankia sp. QA3]
MTDLSEMRPRTAGLRSIPVKPSGWRVLVVENHADDAEQLARGLERHGHKVIKVGSGGEALQAYDDADLVLIDLDLPDLDGLEVCRSIRVADDTPMIAVTGRGSELDTVLALQAGVDDYLVKPYGFRELMARMEAVMRRTRPQPMAAGAIVHGVLRIDAASRQVTVGGRTVELTRKEFQLLHLLASQAGSVIMRKQIMVQVWGDTWSRRTLDTHVSSLRNKLGSTEWIITVRGVGFRLGEA